MSRRVRTGTFVAMGASIALAVVWFVVLPGYRPPLQPGEHYGIDVSHHQGPIDWRRVAADEIEFAYIKATEGATFTDERFRENWEGSAESGLRRGAYHFFSLCSPGRAQARHFLDTVPDDPAALPAAVDLELTGPCERRPDRDRVLEEVGDFLRLVEADTGGTAVLYLGADFEDRYLVADVLDRPLWLLSFLTRPEDEPWVIWQVSGFARVDGIGGNVDLDVMRDTIGP